VSTLSPTKLETARLCEARLAAKMHDEEYEEEQGSGALIGVLAHGAAKNWYRYCYYTNPETGKIVTGEPKPTDVRVPVNTPDEAFEAAMQECAESVDFDGNPASQLPKEPNDVIEARTMFDMIIANYNRDVVKVLYAERRYKGHLSNGVPIHTIIDLILDRGNGVIEVVDFKTGFITCTEDEMMNKDQVLMNLVVLNQDQDLARFPHKQFTYFWVRKGFQTGPVSMPVERLKDYELFLLYEYQRLLNIQEPKESINRFCGSCGRRHKCQKFADFVAEALGKPKELTPEEAAAVDDETLLSQSDLLKGQIQLLESRREAIGEVIKLRMKNANVKEIVGDKFKVRLQQNISTSYSYTTVARLCNERNVNLGDLVSLSKSKVEAAFSSDADAMAALTQTMQKFSTAPFIVVSPKSAAKRTAATAKAALDGSQPAKPRAPRKQKADPAPQSAAEASVAPPPDDTPAL
jgi:hypothetical protein